MRRAGRNDPALVEKECHLLAALVELALRPALHRPGAWHGMRAGVDAELERRAAVRRQTGWGAGEPEDVAVVGGQRGEVWGVSVIRRQAEGGPVRSGSVPSGSVVPVSARPARVSSAQAPAATDARAAISAERPRGRPQRRAAERRSSAKANEPEEGVGLLGRETGRRRRRRG